MTIDDFIEKWMDRGVIYDELSAQFKKDLNKLVKFQIRELEIELEATRQSMKSSWDNDWQQQRIRQLEAELKILKQTRGKK